MWTDLTFKSRFVNVKMNMYRLLVRYFINNYKFCSAMQLVCPLSSFVGKIFKHNTTAVCFSALLQYCYFKEVIIIVNGHFLLSDLHVPRILCFSEISTE